MSLKNLTRFLVCMNPKFREGELRGKRLVNLDVSEMPARSEMDVVILLSTLGFYSVEHAWACHWGCGLSSANSKPMSGKITSFCLIRSLQYLFF